MRHDVLIIWGHGLPELDGILGLVRAAGGFSIRLILQREIEDMPRFVRSVYNFDYAPYRHLIDKTRYLLQVPPAAAFIFLDNLRPDEHTVGKGRFAHIECRNMTALKHAIRAQYNPKVDGQPSEHHVVHGTDHPGQTLATLRLLGYPDIDALTAKPGGVLPTPAHLPPRKSWTLREIDMSRVYARLSRDPGDTPTHTVLPIDQTPHALFLAGQTQDYEAYWHKHRGNRLQEDHTPQAFSSLSQQLDYLGQDYPDSYLLLKPLDADHYVLLDGVHRAAILRSRGIKRFIGAIAA